MRCYVSVEAVMNILKLWVIFVFAKICETLGKCFAQDFAIIRVVSSDKITMILYGCRLVLLKLVNYFSDVQMENLECKNLWLRHSLKLLYYDGVLNL